MKPEIIQEMINKQPKLLSRFKKALQNNTLSHAYLFEGESGTGKQSIAFWLALNLYCQNLTAVGPCFQCNNCERILRNEHPDVHFIEPEGQSIKIEQIRNLKTEFVKSGVETRQKLVILQHADRMTTNAANGLLKFLEEPEGIIRILLLTENKTAILPTIQSRCQVLHFNAFDRHQYQTELIKSGISEKRAKLLSQMTNSKTEALILVEDEWFQTAEQTVNTWFNYLIKNDKQAFVFVQKRLIKVFKEKEQQIHAFTILLWLFRQELTRRDTNQLKGFLAKIEKIMQSQNKWKANVTFQNVCEQLSWQLTK